MDTVTKYKMKYVDSLFKKENAWAIFFLNRNLNLHKWLIGL